jgi:hypothetical protein
LLASRLPLPPTVAVPLLLALLVCQVGMSFRPLLVMAAPLLLALLVC